MVRADEEKRLQALKESAMRLKQVKIRSSFFIAIKFLKVFNQRIEWASESPRRVSFYYDRRWRGNFVPVAVFLGEARVYDVFLLLDGKATHHFTGVISFQAS